MISPKNDYETEIRNIREVGNCSDCGYESDDLREIDYVEWKQGPDYTTPIGRKKEVICGNCFDEYY
jgi:hypothetical protein